jgi:alkylation response protein AidB-like acyl-CoA dehydrogenase
LAQYAQRGILMVRTGERDSGNRGITALFVDMDSPGVTVSSLRGMNGDDEFSEMFFTDMIVPVDRVIGEVNDGWNVVGQILARERATIFWTRVSWLYERLQALVAEKPAVGSSDALIGEVYQLIASLRARSRQTQYAMAEGRFSAPDSSIDKALMAASEQALFDAALELLGPRITLSDEAGDAEWRNQYLYSRAATIYGGTAEIQRNIIAERVLGLPRESKR